MGRQGIWFTRRFARGVLRPRAPVHVSDVFEGFELKPRTIGRGWRARSRYRYRSLEVKLLQDQRTREPSTLYVELWLSVECLFVVKCSTAVSSDDTCFPVTTGDRAFDEDYVICTQDGSTIPDLDFIELWLKVARVRAQIRALIPLGTLTELHAGQHTLTLVLAWDEVPGRSELNGLAAKLLALAATLQLYAAPAL